MVRKKCIQRIAVVLLGLFLCSGCGDMQDEEETQPAVGAQENEEQAPAPEMTETSIEDGESHETVMKENSIMDDSITETLRKIPKEENGILEIYAGRDAIAVDKIMTAQTSSQEILKGNPILYDRFRIDGWVLQKTNLNMWM